MRLLERYFNFAMPTYRFLHRGTVEGWLDEMCKESEHGSWDSPAMSKGRVALVLMLLATAALYKEDDTGPIHDGEAEDIEERSDSEYHFL
jgi:hypothetical protein